MGYIIRRLHRLKKEAKYRVIKQQAGEEDEVKAKRTTLKKAIYQRAILNTVDQVRPHISKLGAHGYFKRLKDPKYQERKPNKKNPHEVDRIVPPPHEVGKGDYEEEAPDMGDSSGSASKTGRSLLRPKAMLKKPDATPKEPEKKTEEEAKESSQERLSDSWYNISDETLNIIIDDLKDARTVNKGTSAELEIKLLRERKPLSMEEMNWLRLLARRILRALKDEGDFPNKHQKARYAAWVIRLIANKQTIPSIVREVDKIEEEDHVLGDYVDVD